MSNNIIITPGSASIQFSGSANNDTIRLQVEASGSVAFYGRSGSLFSITDQLSGSLMSVNDISGLPILEVFSDDRVVMGSVNKNTLIVTGSRVAIGKAVPTATLDVTGSTFLSGSVGISGLTDTVATNKVLVLNTSTNQIFTTTSVGAGGSTAFPYDGRTTQALISGSLLVSASGANNPGIRLTGSIDIVSGSLTGSGDITINGRRFGRGTGTDNEGNLVAGTAFSVTGIVGNTAVGAGAMSLHGGGDYNTAVGLSAMGNAPGASNNVAIGWNALRYAAQSYNTAVGSNALSATNMVSNLNTVVGGLAAEGLWQGDSNTVLGFEAMRNAGRALDNTIVGRGAMIDMTTGSNNVAVGNIAGQLTIGGVANTTPNDNIYIGSDTRAAANNTSNEIVIGTNASGSGTNTFTYGNSSITRHIFRAGTVEASSSLAMRVTGSFNLSGSMTASGGISASALVGFPSGLIITGSITGSGGLYITGAAGINHASGAVAAFIEADPVGNVVNFGASTFHVVNLSINGSPVYQYGVGAFVPVNAGYSIGSTTNKWEGGVFNNVTASVVSASSGITGSLAQFSPRTLRISVGTSAPTSPAVNDLWVDTN